MIKSFITSFRIVFWALVMDVYVTFCIRPQHAIWLIAGVLLAPVYFVVLTLSSKETHAECVEALVASNSERAPRICEKLKRLL